MRYKSSRPFVETFGRGVILLAFLAVSGGSDAQISFDSERLISNSAQGVKSVHTADVDADGDLDVLSASALDGEVSWYQNLGGGLFGPKSLVASGNIGVVNLAARDLDGDAILDVLFSVTSGKLAFVSGLGAGAFGPESVLSLSLGGAAEIEIADMNGDGTLDVLVGDIGVLPLSWFEGIGGGAFGMQQAIGAGTQDSGSICAADLNGDGLLDVLVGHPTGPLSVSWYPNLGNAQFGSQ